MKMSDEAKSHYRLLTDLSYDYGLINLFTYHERIDFLNNNYEEKEMDCEINEKAFLEDTLYNTVSSSSNEIKPLISFLTTQVGILKSKWKFTIGDPDPFPSIPHGHLHQNLKIKLDCYLGYTYDTQNGNKLLKRESKNYIIKLWNDIKFRDFAINHIDWFIYNNPKYKWRVIHKRRLPHIRP